MGSSTVLGTCPICGSALTADSATYYVVFGGNVCNWHNDPIKTPLGLAGAPNIGSTKVCSEHISKLQLKRTQIQDNMAGLFIPPDVPIVFSPVTKEWISTPPAHYKRYKISKTHIDELRESTELILKYYEVSKDTYLNYDYQGNLLTPHKTDWTDPDITGRGVRAIHIEELRKPIPFSFIETWSGLTPDTHLDITADLAGLQYVTANYSLTGINPYNAWTVPIFTYLIPHSNIYLVVTGTATGSPIPPPAQTTGSVHLIMDVTPAGISCSITVSLYLDTITGAPVNGYAGITINALYAVASPYCTTVKYPTYPASQVTIKKNSTLNFVGTGSSKISFGRDYVGGVYSDLIFTPGIYDLNSYNGVVLGTSISTTTTIVLPKNHGYPTVDFPLAQVKTVAGEKAIKTYNFSWSGSIGSIKLLNLLRAGKTAFYYPRWSSYSHY